MNEEDVKLTSLLKNGKTTSDVPMRKKRGMLVLIMIWCVVVHCIVDV